VNPAVAGSVLRASSKDESSAHMTLDDLFTTNAAFVWRNLRRLGVDDGDLEDQTQEVFLVAHRRRESWDGRNPRAWLYAIVRRCAAAYRRRGHRRRELSVEIVPESAGDEFALRIEMDRIGHLIDALEEDKRAVFILYEIDEMPMREVAKAVGCSLKTAYARLYAARRELLKALEENEEQT
jgi:RNA polymerase sigma-70 factor (ECF subfamily)